ncbi:MAG: hypothetical protein N4435_08310 [Candidatus Ornithobacterium hominis]|uniref:hypothetical protein n=1 Tax=Candidatus Ornithobacterium hominis TaxID=2497989 RepID=UPI001058A544|nr:hypothetical protein [Candidatus Ornithobacterium hominis]MCT7905186.1 hypothetical protein [Candidatus Ornithobacterium hominis]
MDFANNQKHNPTLLVAHLHFSNRTKPNKKCKRATKPTLNKATERTPAGNIGFAKERVKCKIQRQ